MSDPLVSIIMPTYNHSVHIGAAVESVLGQTYPNYELIIIDNFSEDETEEIIKSYSDSRICYTKFSNKGIIAASRNFGIQKAKGKYVAFLDSDDIWLPRKIEKQLSLMESNQNVSLSYVLSAYLFPDGSVEGKYPELRHRYKGAIFKKMYLLNPIANSGAMVRKSIFDEIGMLDENPKLVGVEDVDLWLRIALKYSVDYVNNEVQLLYRVRKTSLFVRGHFNRYMKRFRIAKKFYPYSGFTLFSEKIILIPMIVLLKALFKNKLLANP